MNSSDVFETNLSLLELANSKLAFQIRLTDSSELNWSKSKKGEYNLYREYNGQIYYYHSELDIRKETKEWFDSLNLDQVSVIFIYGLGLGYFYEAAKDWLREDPQRSLVFIEQDKSVLTFLLGTELATTLLNDTQVDFVFFESPEDCKKDFGELSWRYINTQFCFTALRLYKEFNSEQVERVKDTLVEAIIQRNAFIDEYYQYGVPFYRNFYPNLFQLPTTYDGTKLFGKFNQIPALICGAGPSLDKNQDLLKNFKDKALIFAGGSALSALIPKGIIPHFGAGIDPNQWQADRILVAKPYNLPFFYRNRLNHEGLLALNGPKLYLPGSGGYDTGQWVDEQLGIHGELLDEGNNVVNLCVEIARVLGCNPIIFVGCDLAFEGEKIYSNQVIEQHQLTAEDLSNSIASEDAPVMRKDIYGEPIKTLWKWVIESTWISDYAKNHPDITFINASEAGIGFEGIPNMTLNSVSEQHLISTFPLIQKIEQACAHASLAHISGERIEEILITLRSSLEHIITNFDKLTNELKLLKADLISHKVPENTTHNTTITLIEAEIEEECGFWAILDMFSQIFQFSHLKEIQNIESLRSKFITVERSLMKIELQMKRLTYLKDAATVNIALINRAIEDSYQIQKNQ